MTGSMLLLPILLPVAIALVTILIPSRVKYVREVISVLGSVVLLYYGYTFFTIKNLTWKVSWLGNGVDFDLRLYHFSAFILLWINIFVLLITIYARNRMAVHHRLREFYCYLFLTGGLTGGVAYDFKKLTTFAQFE